MRNRKPVILCVDDEPRNLDILEGALAPRGYEIVRAANGPAALALIGERRIDLALLDVMMPEMSGFEACRRIKEDERTRGIPVILITALTSKEDRTRGIEAGAEDFITKPFDRGEVLARIRMLLKMKDLNDNLNSAYAKIADLTGFGEQMAASFDPLNFNFISTIDRIVSHIIRRTPEAFDRPRMMIVGFLDECDAWQWHRFEPGPSALLRTRVDLDLQDTLELPPFGSSGGMNMMLFNEGDGGDPRLLPFIGLLRTLRITVTNAVCFVGETFCIFALNYDKEVTRYDAEVVNSIAMQSLFLRSLSSQVRETEDAFAYTVRALARAAEAHDEDTGNHILRVGEYCALVSRRLGLPEAFSDVIRTQAQMHDVGKIHTPAAILRKPDKLTPREWEEMKRHTMYGMRILGDHLRLKTAKSIALTHHERWDGSGYHGLKGDRIPLEGRIVNIADQYDALRNARVYKPAFDHATTHRILTEGDGRTIPCHFDPEVLRAYRDTASQFEEVYEKMKD